MSLEQRVGQTMGHAGVAVSGVYLLPITNTFQCPNLLTQFLRKQAQKRSFSVIENHRFWACFRENWVFKFGHGRSRNFNNINYRN
jgi:hypothetical protein